MRISSVLIFPVLLLLCGCAPVVTRDGGNAASGKIKPLFGARKGRAPNVAPQNRSIAQMENAVRNGVNAQRRKHGLQPLEGNQTLDRIAREYSRRMNREKFFSHYDAKGKSAADRVRAADVSYNIVGENLFLSVNARSPVSGAVQGWMKSKDHRVNILTKDFTQTGVGIWKSGRTMHFTQIFIRPL